MEAIVASILAMLIKDAVLTAFSASMLILAYIGYIHKYLLGGVPEDHKTLQDSVNTLMSNQAEIKNQQMENTNKLLLHTKESSDNSSNICKIKESVSKIEGMLSIMSLNTSRGIK